MSETDKGTILLVEDEATFQRIYSDVLAAQGYRVLQATDGETGWALAKKEVPDLILLDLVLPQLHGFEVLKRIRADEDTKDIPVVIFSVLGEGADTQKGMDLGATDYTVKGFYSPKQVVAKIQKILEKRLSFSHGTTYRLSLDPRKGEAREMQDDLGLQHPFNCPTCSEAMEVEFIPDYSRRDGHWFWAHFECMKCGKGF